MRDPGIEPGSVPWQGTILPLNQPRFRFMFIKLFLPYTTLLITMVSAQAICTVQTTTEDHESSHDALPYWKAPELLKHGPYTAATDVYAFGMLVYEVLFRRDPFAGESVEVSPNLACDSLHVTCVQLCRLGVSQCEGRNTYGFTASWHCTALHYQC